jgi:hypothetical protein
MGFETYQLNVLFRPLVLTLIKRPLDTFIKFPGTFTLINMLSTSSYIWSLLHQTLAPNPDRKTL